MRSTLSAIDFTHWQCTDSMEGPGCVVSMLGLDNKYQRAFPDTSHPE